MMEQFMNLCNQRTIQHSHLIIAALGPVNGQGSEYMQIKSAASSLSARHSLSACKILISTIRSPFPDRQANDVFIVDVIFSRFPRILDSANIFVIRSSTILNSESMERAELNTLAGQQVYFPIPFQRYRLGTKARSSQWPVSKEDGTFLWFDFRQYSFNIKDFLEARKLLKSIRLRDFDAPFDGLNKYDSSLDVLELFIKFNCHSREKKLRIFRSPDPGMKLKFSTLSPTFCSSNEADVFSKNSCNESYFLALGSKNQLAGKILNSDRKQNSDA